MDTKKGHIYGKGALFKGAQQRFGENLWREEGGRANGATAPGIQRVKLQKLKCCNYMIFPIVSLLIHAEWI